MSSLVDTLRSRGHRITVARSALLTAFGAGCDPLSAQDAHTRLTKQGMNVNMATIYRELAFLEGEGLLRALRFRDGVQRYELASAPHHHHVVCTGCNRIESVHLDRALCEAGRDVERATGFTSVHHALEFFGRCFECSTSSSPHSL